jgi:hypothetical protein
MSEFRNGAGLPVVALDIDGTLGDYHGHFIRFAETWLGYDLPSPDEINPGLRLSTFLGLPHDVYRQIKLAYRQGGQKRTMPAYPGAASLSSEVHEEAKLWICTTRPYQRHDNIDPDTREWLRRNHVKHDAILFEDLDEGTPKWNELIRQVGLYAIVAIADDLPQNIDSALEAGIPRAYLMSQPYNQGYRWDTDKVVRVTSLVALRTMILNDIRQWKENNGV